MELILDKVKKVDYHDPWVPGIEIGKRKFKSVPLTAPALKKADCVVDSHRPQSLRLRLHLQTQAS